MLARLASSVTLVALALFAVGCASENWAEDEADGDSALSGRVTEGRIVQTVTDALRLRKTPSLANTKNVIGLIPKGTNVKILDGEPTDGFYKVEVLDEPVRAALVADIGWVFGEYLNGDAEEPEVEEEEREVSLTGTHDVPTEVRVDFVMSDCKDMVDDRGHPMAPTIDDVLENGSPYAVLAIDTNTFSYGMTARIKEVDQQSSFNITGAPVTFKIVKTARTQPRAGFTVMLCGRPASKLVLPTDGGKLNLSVFPN